MNKALVKATHELIEVYDKEHPTGGNLHIVLDDFNLEDEHIDYCIKNAEQENDDIGYALGILLRMLDYEERAAAISPLMCRCGHSIIAHYFTSDDGKWGASGTGACHVFGCDCSDVVHSPSTTTQMGIG